MLRGQDARSTLSGLTQGFGLGCTFVPLNTIALSTLPRHIMTQGTAIRSLMRNLDGSIGISVLVADLKQNTELGFALLASTQVVEFSGDSAV